MSKVYFIGGRYDGCFYYRCELPMRYGGWDGDKIVGNSDSTIFAKKAMEADIVVFQRPEEQSRLMAMKALKKLGKKIVFENDDTFRIDIDIPLRPFLEERKAIIDEAIRISDLATTTTDWLAKEYKIFNDNVAVLPNQIDPDDFGEPLKNDGKKRIGLYGSVVANGEYHHIKKALKKISKKFQLVVLGLPPITKESKILNELYKDDYKFWASLDVEWHPNVRFKDFYEKLRQLRLDLLLIPRQDSYFNRCKSNVKFLEASMLEIPIIAQGFKDGQSPYERDPEDRKYMTIVHDEDWYDVVMDLDWDFIKQRAKEAKKYVSTKYNIKTNYKLWQKTYEQLLIKN